MVRAGEESGKLDQTFVFLADYMDRNFELTSKARNALIYPAFISTTFVAVMTLMLTFVIPKIGDILISNGGTLPIYTQITLDFSAFLVDYGIFILIALIIGGYFVYRYTLTPAGRLATGRLKITLPYIGDLFRKLYLTRIADNMHVMLSSGISAVRALEITAAVVDNDVYKKILTETVNDVKPAPLCHRPLRAIPRKSRPFWCKCSKLAKKPAKWVTSLSVWPSSTSAR